MDFEATSSGILFVAAWMGADEGFLTSVGELMGLQMTFGNERLLALLAHKWSFASVSTHMSL